MVLSSQFPEGGAAGREGGNWGCSGEEEAAAHVGKMKRKAQRHRPQPLPSLGFEQLKSRALGGSLLLWRLDRSLELTWAAALTIASAGPAVAWPGCGQAGLGGHPGLEGVKLFTAFGIVCSPVQHNESFLPSVVKLAVSKASISKQSPGLL